MTLALSRRSIAVVAAALSLSAAGTSPPAAFPPAAPTTHTVTIDALQFQPAELTIAAGDAVVWVNKDPFPHTATSKAGGFDSGEIAAAKSWKFVAAKTGEFEYICTLHPTMKGKLRVE